MVNNSIETDTYLTETFSFDFELLDEQRILQ